MRRQLAISGLLTMVLLGLVASPALAGGWAVTTLDEMPSSVQAGQTYDIGFTIRQHGSMPFNQAQPRIRAELGDTYLSFGATRNGEGHYVARVEFPREGAWTWRVDQTPFATQELGTLTVVPVPAAAAAVEAAAAPAVAAVEPVAAPAVEPVAALAVEPIAPAVAAAGEPLTPQPAASAGSFEQGLLGYALAGLLAVVVLVWRRPIFNRARGAVR